MGSHSLSHYFHPFLISHIVSVYVIKIRRKKKEEDCPSLISLVVSVDVKHHVYLLKEEERRWLRRLETSCNYKQFLLSKSALT